MRRCFVIALTSLLLMTSAAVADGYNNCDPLILVADEGFYGSSTTNIGPVLPELQSRFDAALQEVCRASTGTWDWRVSPSGWFTELNLHNNNNANIMGIYWGEDEQSLFLEVGFEDAGVLAPLPETEEFRRALICVSELERQFALDPTECLPD
jgi:hypothetical protein